MYLRKNESMASVQLIFPKIINMNFNVKKKMYQVIQNLSIHDLNHKFIKNLSLVLYYHINFTDNTIPRDFYHVIYNQPIYHRSQIILHFPARFLYIYI